MRTFTIIQINAVTCDGNTCGPCEFRQIALNTGESRCGLFGKLLRGEGKPIRCGDCWSAETAALTAEAEKSQ